MRIGGLRHVGQFSKSGQRFTRRVDVRGLTTREMIAQDEFVGEDAVKVRVRYDRQTAEVGPRWIIQVGSKQYHISTAYDPTGLQREIVMLAARRS